MFWNCQSCGTQKLLGITHRHCPNCGAAQDETKRYFPNDGEEIALENHIYYGVDWDCQYCSTPNSNNSNNCVNCGGPKEGAEQVQLIGSNNKIIQRPKKKVHSNDIHQATHKIYESPTPVSKDWSKNLSEPPTDTNKIEKTPVHNFVIGFFVLAFIALVAFFIYGFTHVTPETVQVSNTTWKRSIDIEEYVSYRDDDWCSSMPSAAYNISKTREVRSHKSVPDGQTCSTVKSDNGDGSFRKERVCDTKYKSIPVYDNRCHYSLNKWSFKNRVLAAGNDKVEPHWPELTAYHLNNNNRLGNLREGSHSEYYDVEFTYKRTKDESLKSSSCSYSQSIWKSFFNGQIFTANFRMIGGMDCSSVTPLKTY